MGLENYLTMPSSGVAPIEKRNPSGYRQPMGFLILTAVLK
jgi:hypothetical protein